MIERFTQLLKTFSEEKEQSKKVNTLLKARKEVEINGSGTSGYVVKYGSNKGRVLGHIIQKSNNNW